MSAVKWNVVQIDRPTIPILLIQGGVIYRHRASLCPRFLKPPLKKDRDNMAVASGKWFRPQTGIA